VGAAPARSMVDALDTHSITLSKSYKSVTGVLQECYKSVTRVLQECYKSATICATSDREMRIAALVVASMQH
jgi:hypothetical protein